MSLIEDVEQAKLASGKNEYLKILKGEAVCASAAIKAKCFDCCGYYEDGKEDCGVADCPLYAWMPFGTAKKQRPKKTLTIAQKEALGKMRAGKPAKVGS